MTPELEQIGLMLAKPAPIRSRPGWIYELKYDGYRILAGRDGGALRLRTRERRDATSWYPDLVDVLTKVPGRWVLDAEVCALNGMPDFAALNSLRGRGIPVALFAFDILFHKGRDLRQLPLLDRKARLKLLIPAAARGLGHVDYIEEKGEEVYAHAVQLKLEGVVAKKADSPYIAGRSNYWLKTTRPGYMQGWKRSPDGT